MRSKFSGPVRAYLDLCEGLAPEALSPAGLEASRVLRFLQKNIGKRLAEVIDVRSDLHLVTDGKNIYLEDNSNSIIDILKNARQPMFLVCVSDQVRRIQATLPPMRKPVGRESASAQAVRKAR